MVRSWAGRTVCAQTYLHVKRRYMCDSDRSPSHINLKLSAVKQIGLMAGLKVGL